MSGITYVANPSSARNLAQKLLNPNRNRPIVIVTVAADGAEPSIDANKIFDQVGDLVDVFVISSMIASWEFADSLPEGPQVYGGAGRVYPVGTKFLADKHLAPLQMVLHARDADLATQKLISAALSMSHASGSTTLKPSVVPKTVSGKIEGLVAGRVLVKLEDSGYASIAPELLLPGFSPDQLLRKGQKVDGELDPESRRLDISKLVVSQQDALENYEVGDVVLTEVQAVAEDSVKLTLFPKISDKAVVVNIPKNLITNGLDEDLRHLFTPGDVVKSRLISVAPYWAMVLTDIEENEPVVQAPSLIKGGPPWLTMPTFEIPELLEDKPGTPELELDTDSVAQESGMPLHGRKLTTQLLLAIENSKVQREELTNQIRIMGVHLEQAENDRNTLAIQLREEKRQSNIYADELAKLRSRLRKTKTTKVSSNDIPQFADPEMGFRHLVLSKWALRVPVGEQSSKPLSDYVIGAKFIQSLKELQGISTDKVADVVVEVLIGVASELDSREVHRLREGAGAMDPPVKRADGAVCWRASLQVGTPSARRLHYWILPKGLIELSRVTVHDDFNP